MPIIIGALSLAFISIISLQGGASNRLSDTQDAQVVSVNFENDVQAAVELTSAAASTAPAPCGTGTQVLGIQLGNGTDISYMLVAGGAQSAQQDSMYRNVCQGTTLTSSRLISHDVPTSETAAINCVGGPCPGATTGWIAATGVIGVTFSITQAQSLSQYAFTLTAVPNASTNSTQVSKVNLPQSGCGFANPGTGTYASHLCLVDFTSWNGQQNLSGVSCASGYFGMSAIVTNTPYTMTFCMKVSSVNSAGSPITGVSGAGYNGIAAVSLPTYTSPQPPPSGDGSEAFLGNNGFYVGIPGDPALYTTTSGSTSTISINNISVIDSAGNSVAGWELVTGDAESTDTNESIAWSTNGGSALNLLWNSPASPVGNACESIAPTINTTFLQGVGTSTVKCSANSQVNKTGTVMLEAATPSSLTVTMKAAGLQAMFLGLLLS